MLQNFNIMQMGVINLCKGYTISQIYNQILNELCNKKRKFTPMGTIQKFKTKPGSWNLYAVKFVIESI